MSRFLIFCSVLLIFHQAFSVSDERMMLMLGCLQLENKNYKEATHLLNQISISNYANDDYWKIRYNSSFDQKEYAYSKFATIQSLMANDNPLDTWHNLYDNAEKINDNTLKYVALTAMDYSFPNDINIYDKIELYKKDIDDKNIKSDLIKRKYFWLSSPTFNVKYLIQGKPATDGELNNLSSVDYRANQALSARYWAKGETVKAIEYANLAFKAFPAREDNIISLSSMMVLSGKLEEAAEVMKSASAYGYRDVDYAYGYLSYALGKFKDSAETFRRLRNRDILNLEYCIHEVGAALAGGDVNSAYNTLKVSSALYKDINLDFLFLTTLIKMNKYDDALAYMKSLSGLWDDDLVLKIVKIKILLGLKKYGEALNESTILIDKVPELSGILYYCGVAAVRDSNLSLTDKTAKKLIELSVIDSENIKLALQLYIAVDMLAQAREAVGKLLSEKNNLTMKNYNSICRVAEATSECGMWNEAIQAGYELIKINPNDVKGYIFIGAACEQLNRINEAKIYYRKSEQLKASEYDIKLVLNYYVKTGNFDDALRVYKTIKNTDKDDEYDVLLGDYLAGNGDLKAAEKCWKQTTEKYPGSLSVRTQLRLYNLEKNNGVSTSDTAKLKESYLEWVNKQKNLFEIILKKYKIQYNEEDLTKLLSLQDVVQEYSALLK